MIRDAMKVWVLTGLLLGCFGSAFAGTVRLRSGTLDFESLLSGDGPVHLEARGFSFDGFAQTARLDAADCVFPCEPQETFSLFATVGGNDLPGVAIMGDKEWVDVGSLLTPDFMSITITGKGVVPLLGTVTEKIRRYRVKLVGQFVHYEGVPIAPVVEELVAVATAVVTWTKYEDDAWSISHLTYTIASNR
jgi:hypothetical protein